jgi:predicted HTH domain antitoxin
MAQPKTEQLNVRLPKSLLRGVEEVAEVERLDRTAVIRKLIAEGLERYRLDRAVRLYAEGRISKARAAEMAGISIYEMLDEIEKRGLRSPYTIEDIRQDLELLRVRYARSRPIRRKPVLRNTTS